MNPLILVCLIVVALIVVGAVVMLGSPSRRSVIRRRAEAARPMTRSSDFWDALAPHHSSTENNYLNPSSLRRIVHDIHQPVLVVGAGQGLIVAELRKNGFRSDGVDLSSEMIRYAKTRRGHTFVQADASAMPFREGTYETIIYATGVVDFIGDEEQIRVILNEARRVINRSGNIFVAFYRFSAASEDFLTRLGLLRNNVLSLREALEIHRLNPIQAIAWAAKKTEAGYFRAGILSLRSWALSTMREKTTAFTMQRIFRKEAYHCSPGSRSCISAGCWRSLAWQTDGPSAPCLS